ncbi:MAG: EAL domain-containing response regulator [Gallionella sp.]|nr:EAL domain-containing response regulator [Gallionella sp.]
MIQQSVKIMVLDDEPFMLKLLARMLASLGYTQVSTCNNGHAALDMIDSPAGSPNLILLDINMPEMDGLEFVRRLVEWRYNGSIILVSGEDERMQQAAEELARAHKITVLGHLHKPATPGGLAELIEKWKAPEESKPRPKKKVYDKDELRAAIANGELVNYYQPKVATATGRVTGVETLVRWRHPADGMVFPDQFIGVAEAHGLIDGLTRSVLVSALEQARLWLDAGLELQVAVNLSMDNLTSLEFSDMVADLADRAGVPPQMMEFEVTESRLMEDLRVPLEILTRLRLKRFRLSIDDFGTGNSSLAQLRDLPFDELKIDQSFVRGACNNKKLQAIFDSSLSLAKQLGMEAVAEGVEDRDDWDFVRKSGCDIAQGYFIAKPMPAAGLPAWIRTWQKDFSASSRYI